MDVVQETWDEIGSQIRANGNVVWVRTDPPRRITPGGIILTDKQVDFFYGLPRGVVSTALVVAVGPKSDPDIHVGDRVYFLRLDFAWSRKLKDGSLLGWARDDVIMLREPCEDQDDAELRRSA